jgi:hypothetical protein
VNLTVHPSYNFKTFLGDIAVLILSTEVELTEFVRPVCLWYQDKNHPEDIVNQTGQVRFHTASFYEPIRDQATQNTNTHT